MGYPFGVMGPVKGVKGLGGSVGLTRCNGAMGSTSKKTETPLKRPGGRPKRRLPQGWVAASDIALAVGFGPRWVRQNLGALAIRLNNRDYRWRTSDVNQWLVERGLSPLAEQ